MGVTETTKIWVKLGHEKNILFASFSSGKMSWVNKEKETE